MGVFDTEWVTFLTFFSNCTLCSSISTVSMYICMYRHTYVCMYISLYRYVRVYSDSALIIRSVLNSDLNGHFDLKYIEFRLKLYILMYICM